MIGRICARCVLRVQDTHKDVYEVRHLHGGDLESQFLAFGFLAHYTEFPGAVMEAGEGRRVALGPARQNEGVPRTAGNGDGQRFSACFSILGNSFALWRQRWMQ